MDLTLEQVRHVVDLLENEDPRRFLQGLASNWGAVQRIGRGEWSQASLQEAMRGLATSNPYANEKVPPTRFYPDAWPVVTSRQWVEKYQRVYPGLDTSCITKAKLSLATLELVLPSWVDRRPYWRPKLSRVGELLGLSDPYGRDYGSVLEHLSGLLATSYGEGNFVNYQKGALTERHVRLHSASRAYMEDIDGRTVGDYVLELGSFGKEYGGFSGRNALGDIAMRGGSRWPWNAFVVGHILLVDHVRLGANGLLNVDTVGDEYDPGGQSQFRYCLSFCFVGRLRFHCSRLGDPSGSWGSAVGLCR